jgi:hypothetical protein
MEDENAAMMIILALALAGCAVQAPTRAPDDYPVLTISADSRTRCCSPSPT